MAAAEAAVAEVAESLFLALEEQPHFSNHSWMHASPCIVESSEAAKTIQFSKIS